MTTICLKAKKDFAFLRNVYRRKVIDIWYLVGISTN